MARLGSNMTNQIFFPYDTLWSSLGCQVKPIQATIFSAYQIGIIEKHYVIIRVK